MRVVFVAVDGDRARDGHDPYVALTRATHRLTVVYDGDLPACLPVPLE